MRRIWLLMLPPAMLLVVILFCLSCATCGTNTFSSIDDNSGTEGLRIWLDDEDVLQNVPLYIPTSTAIRLMNTHPTDSMEVYDIESVSEDNASLMFVVVEESLPILLSPGEIASFPLTVIPQQDESMTNAMKRLSSFQVLVDSSRGSTSSGSFSMSIGISNKYGLPKVEEIVPTWKKLTGIPISLHNPSSDEDLIVYEFFTSDPSWMDIKWNSNAWKNVSGIGGPITIPYEKDVTIGSVMLKWDSFVLEFNITSAGKVEENMVVGYVHIQISQYLIIFPLQVSTKKLVAELIVPLLKK